MTADDERDQGTWIGGLIDAAAREYEPDGERLRELVAARIAEDADGRRSPSRRLRSGRAGAAGLRTRLNRTFSVGAAIGAVGAAVAIAVGVTAMLAVGSPRANSTASGVGGGPGASAAATVPGSTPSAAPSDTGPSAGRTSPPSGSAAASDSYTATERIDQASNPDWTQLDVVVTAKQPLTALVITIRVAECPGLGSPKSYDTGDYGAFGTSSATAPDGSVSFVFTLVAGQTLAPGTVEFAAQFNHGAAGWHAAADSYRISAQAAAAPGAAVTDGVY